MAKGRPAKCPHCGSYATRAKGYRKTVTMGLRRRRICKDCKRMFTVGDMAGKANPVKSGKKRMRKKK